MHPAPQILEQLVQRIVEAVHPLRIILFGSAARGEMTADSDLDVLVVMPEGTHRRQTARIIRQNLGSIEIPVDVVVAVDQDLYQFQDNFSLIYYPALREGKDLYVA